MSRRALLACLLLAGCTEAPPPPRPARPPEPVKILHFYASPSVVERGGRPLVCYGVENARAVRIEPPVETLRPAFNRCFHVSPERDTTYTLIAEDGGGNTVSQKIAVPVVARAPARKPEPAAQPGLILSLAASATDVARGLPVTICYQVAPGASVQVEPAAGPLKPGEKACLSVTPQQTTTYTVTASAGARRDRQSITIRVR